MADEAEITDDTDTPAIIATTSAPHLPSEQSKRTNKSRFNKDSVRRISRHQSMHFYKEIEQITSFTTMEDRCKSEIQNYISLIDDDDDTVAEDHILESIFEYTDIAPLNRKEQFEEKWDQYKDLINYVHNMYPNHTSHSYNNNNGSLRNNTTADESNVSIDEALSDDAVANLQSQIDRKWAIGETHNDYFPILNEQTIHGIYFADIQAQMRHKIQIVGSIRDPAYVQLQTGINLDSISKDEWDPCWDVFFYCVCYETGNHESGNIQFRGQVCYSDVWSNLLIFGIDEDFIREACETGEWEYGGNKRGSNNVFNRKTFGKTKFDIIATKSIDSIPDGNESDINDEQYYSDEKDDSDSEFFHEIGDIVTNIDDTSNRSNSNTDETSNETNATNDENKTNITNDLSSLYVVCSINNDTNEVNIMDSKGNQSSVSTSQVTPKFPVREQRDVDDLKQGLLPLSGKQLHFIFENKKFDDSTHVKFNTE